MFVCIGRTVKLPRRAERAHEERRGSTPSTGTPSSLKYCSRYPSLLASSTTRLFAPSPKRSLIAPQYASDIFLMLMFPGGLAMAIWFLVKGVDVAKWNAKLSAAN